MEFDIKRTIFLRGPNKLEWHCEMNTVSIRIDTGKHPVDRVAESLIEKMEIVRSMNAPTGGFEVSYDCVEIVHYSEIVCNGRYTLLTTFDPTRKKDKSVLIRKLQEHF
jgi:hypothetical protein